MRSIWSKNYSPFDKSTPFFTKIKADQDAKSQPAASTYGMSKTISFASQTDSVKRKIEHIDLDEDSNSTSSSMPESSESKPELKIEKKFKPDLDQILSEYSQEPSVSLATNRFSSYFSSVNSVATSPVLNKVCI